VQDGIAHPWCGQIHHRIADVPDLDVEQCDELAVLLMQLTGIPHDRRLSSACFDGMAFEPPQHEFE